MGWDRAGRVRRKAMTRTSWYRPYSAVGFYPPTPGHVLRDRLQAAMTEEAARIGITVKIIETGGRSLASDLVKLNLTPCPMTNCWPCASAAETGEKGASHTKGSSLYRGDCVPCLEEGKKVAYVGESGFSGSHRLTTEHRPDITRGDLSNAFAKHAAAAHPDRARDPSLFKVKVLGTFGTCIDRQVAEGCELAYPADPDQKWLNSREEWHQPSLNRVTVTREVRQPRRNSNNTGNSSRRPGRN